MFWGNCLPLLQGCWYGLTEILCDGKCQPVKCKKFLHFTSRHFPSQIILVLPQSPSISVSTYQQPWRRWRQFPWNVLVKVYVFTLSINDCTCIFLRCASFSFRHWFYWSNSSIPKPPMGGGGSARPLTCKATQLSVTTWTSPARSLALISQYWIQA